MDWIVTFGIITITVLGALYAVGLVVAAILGPDPTVCDCGCEQEIPAKGWCSSECDQKCQENNHYEDRY